ncbi:Quinolone resistance protein NorA [Marine Group I thaumarchaeote SCGC AAA799-E16]|uniref:Quinolone resistance protein NorA n=4 Tax=Marine Group I TaxID=905826 RepID=A0A081RM30_9ARCH|nr:Quinolone resistance protein NorA [Marine Group I thaumarchaeote SCGC AAA799-N04]KER06175.1 Quinolone resistance protein NorA [Marine Group I thaumarchaeote SCGC AAA799-E16]KFM15513.1 Quinolone resistance protein NorA [Marine Group I thaumarchaeote SCGC AAA799-D11]KFM19240.1 major facilitator transporter protein [Marine Group I thaumarchaeote SCGC RSA3]
MNKVLILVNITGLIIGISYGLHGPILPVFAKNVIGATYSELGLIGLANFIPYMFIPLFVGILLDRFNNGYLLALGTVINSTSIYLLSIAQSVPEIMGFRILTGVAHAFFWPPCESIISNESTEKNRVRNISWFTMFFVIGFMVGPLLGTVFLEGLDTTYRVLFQITAFILATALISSILVSRKSVRSHHGHFSFSSIKEMKRFPEVIVLLLFCTSSFGIILTIYPAFLNDNGMTDTDILLLFFVFGISRVVSLALAGKLARKTSQTLIAAVSTISLGLAISAAADSIIMFAVALVLMGFGFSIFFPLTLEIILSKTKKGISGKIIGAYETVFGMGWLIGPTLGGPITQSFGDDTPYLIFCVIGIGVALLAIISRKKLEPQRVLY